MIQIAVLGSEIAPKKVLKIAEEVGAEIARHNMLLICGGRKGVMEAAAYGCKKAGGITLGILPSLDKNEANQYIDIIIPTSFGYARNTLVASAADVVIAIDGNYGTLSEIAFALNYDRDVIIIEGTGGTADFMCNSIYKIHKATNAKEAVELAIKLVDL